MRLSFVDLGLLLLKEKITFAKRMMCFDVFGCGPSYTDICLTVMRLIKGKMLSKCQGCLLCLGTLLKTVGIQLSTALASSDSTPAKIDARNKAAIRVCMVYFVGRRSQQSVFISNLKLHTKMIFVSKAHIPFRTLEG